MNTISNSITKFSTQLYLAVPKFRMPVIAAPRARIADAAAEAGVSAPAAEAQSKPTKEGSEALGLSLVALLILGIGTAWALIVVQVALMAAEIEPLLVRNILWTHQ
jgi:hypothetical protein